jgi:dolichol-phosphate mannosyltransferase
LALYNIIAKLTGIIQLVGYTTTIFSIWFVGGMILFVLGIVGLYIERIFTQVKGRQLFIVKKEINIHD